MKSEEINKRIDEAENKWPAGEPFIPFIGWYWRHVDFDNGPMTFGRIPFDKIGFMENNKWDYAELDICPSNPLFNKIKSMIEESLIKFEESGDFDVFNPVYDEIQELEVHYKKSFTLK